MYLQSQFKFSDFTAEQEEFSDYNIHVIQYIYKITPWGNLPVFSEDWAEMFLTRT